MKTIAYDNPSIGCYVDASAGHVNDCNRRTIEFAEEYGFNPGMPRGCFDGLRGLEIEMSLDDAESCSHQGECFEDVQALVATPAIALQLDNIGAEAIRAAMKESGGFSAEELADDDANRNRAVWMAACDIRENCQEWLSEVGDAAVEFLNGLETRSFMYWTFDDNSLFLLPNVDGAKEDCGFVSVKSLADARRLGIETDPQDSEYPPVDYRGEWLHINERGNCTLYVRGEDGKDSEVWSVV